MITRLISVLLGVLVGFAMGCAYEYVVDHTEKRQQR